MKERNHRAAQPILTPSLCDKLKKAVGRVGVEPTRSCEQRILSPTDSLLTVSTLPHASILPRFWDVDRLLYLLTLVSLMRKLHLSYTK